MERLLFVLGAILLVGLGVALTAGERDVARALSLGGMASHQLR